MNFIWGTCNILRGPYKRNEYRRVILPLTVLRRFDCLLAPTKAGVFAERAASVVADHLIASVRGEATPPGYDGTGSCYIEFGTDGVARVDVDFFSTPGRPTGVFTPPSPQATAEKAAFASTRFARWFGA